MLEDNGDFITQYKQQVMSIKDVNEQWAEDIALALLSTYSHKVKFSTTKGRIPLNVWIIAVAPSSASKSLPLREFAYPMLRATAELSGNIGVNYRLPSSFTPEAMTEHLTQQNIGIIFRDEVSTMFKETSGKGYTIQLLEFLSTLYDGRIQGRHTITHGDRDARDCYVVFLGATTPYLYNVLDQQIFIQGLGNRILWNIFEPGQKHYEPNDLFSQSIENITQGRLTMISEYAKLLLKLAVYENIIIQVNEYDEAARLLTRSFNKLEELAVQKDNEKKSLEALYLRKSNVHLLKLCALKRLGRELPNLVKPVPNKDEKIVLIVESQDVVWAQAKIDYYIKSFFKMLKNWQKSPIKPPVESLDNWFEAIIDAVNSCGGLASRQEIMKMTKISNIKMTDILNSMLEAGVVERVSPKDLSESVCEKHNVDKHNPHQAFMYKLVKQPVNLRQSANEINRKTTSN